MKTILYIEDCPIQRQLASIILVSTDYNIILSDNVQDSISILKSKKVDLILLDLILKEGECGIEILDFLESRGLGGNVIIVSGWVDRYSDILKNYAGLVMDCLEKPFSGEELVSKVHKNLLKIF